MRAALKLLTIKLYIKKEIIFLLIFQTTQLSTTKIINQIVFNTLKIKDDKNLKKNQNNLSEFRDKHMCTIILKILFFPKVCDY